jgi:hypothetical protein
MESLGRTLTSDSTLQAEQLGVDLGMVAADDAAVLQAVDALVDRGGREADRLADLGVGGPGVGLEGPDDGQVGVVERGPQRLGTLVDRYDFVRHSRRSLRTFGPVRHWRAPIR